MASNARELKNELLDFILSIRLTTDRKSSPLELDHRIEIAAQLEMLRVMIRQVDPGRSPFLFDDDLLKILNIARNIRGVIAESGIKNLRAGVINAGRRDTIVGVHTRDGMANYDLSDLVVAFIEDFPADHVLVSADFQVDMVELLENDSTPGERLAAIVPQAKISPVNFDIVDDVLRITHTEATAKSQDVNNIYAARATLIEEGRKIMEAMERSNCDQRFVADISALQTKLETSQDIIQLGIMNLSCDEQRKQFEAELPDVIASKLRAHLASVGMYVAQFQEWARFTENAAAVELSASDIRKTKDVALAMADTFEAMPDKVSLEVPQTIRLMAEAVSDPALASKRIGFALMRTLENLFIRVFGVASQFLDESIKKSIGVGSAAVSVGLGAAILAYATNLATVYSKIPGMDWLKMAADVFGKALSTKLGL